MNYKNILSLLVPVLLLLQLPLSATPVPFLIRQDYKKTFTETFDVDGSGSVKLENRYGEIKVETWERDEVRIEVTVKVSASDQDAADRMFDRIEINFSESGNQASATTNIGNGRRQAKSIIDRIIGGDWWNNGNSSNDFRIYYRVQMPSSADLNTEAKYCDVELPNLSGNTKLKVGYGDLVSGDLSGSNEISVSYGSARLGKLGEASTFRIRYSEGNIQGADELRYDGRYSESRIGPVNRLVADIGYEELDLESAEEIRLNGSYNKMNIDQVGRLFIDGNYNNFDVGQVIKELEVDAAYGDLEIDGLSAGFDRVYIRTRYIAVEIDVDSDAGFEFELRSRHGGISYPSDAKMSVKEKEGSSRYYRGSLAGKGNGKIDISTTYGDIDID